MAKVAQQVQSRSLWGRMTGRAAKREHAAAPIAAPVTHRPLTVRDALWTVDATGRRQYVPLTLEGQPGKWAGREWQHCGDRDGVMVVAWQQRYDPYAPMFWCALAGGAVHVVEGGTVA